MAISANERFCIVIFRFKNGIQVFYKYKSPVYKVTFSAIELFLKSYFKCNSLKGTEVLLSH